MTRDTRNFNKAVSSFRYNHYMQQLLKAENPLTVYAATAISIGKCKEYTKTEKGRALEALTMAWTDLFED